MRGSLAAFVLVGAVGCDLVFTVPDRPDGGGGSDVAPNDGAWTYPPSNFDVQDPYIVSGGADEWIATSMQYDTNAAPPPGTPPVSDVVLNRVTVRLVRVRVFRVPNGTVLDIIGKRPLIIAADTVDIAGTVLVRSGRGDNALLAPCVIRAPQRNACGVGGPGGAFAGGGGQGGNCGNTTTTPAQPAVAPPLLVPLFGGCPGGTGDGATSSDGGIGGIGGGALQISVRVAMTMAATGQILAGGVKGLGGVATSGGGGGGAGGAILLEGPMLQVSRVCAEGGGGGAGGTATLGDSGHDGCDTGKGGAGTGNNGAGGDGSVKIDGAGQDGGDAQTEGGGGGGGGAGRIVIRADKADGVSNLVSPNPSIIPL